MLLHEAAANSGDEKDTDTFLTGAKIEDKNNLSNFDSIENSQALVEQHLQSNPHYNRRRGVNQSVQQKSGSNPLHKRTQSQGISNGPSRYKNIPSENLKFQQFIDLIFDSKMQKEDVKFEVISYV